MNLIWALFVLALVASPLAVAVRSWRKLEKRDDSHLIALIFAAVILMSPFYTHISRSWGCFWNGDTRYILYPLSAVAFIFAFWAKMDRKRSVNIAFRLAIMLNSAVMWCVCGILRRLACID